MSYLFAGYAVVWLGVFGYLFWLGNQARQLQQRLDRLEGSQRKASAGSVD